MMSIADALRLYHETDIPASSVGMEPLDIEALENLHLVEGYANPDLLAGQLAAAIRTLWVARKSGELSDEDADDTLCLLAEVASLLEHTIEANSAAVWWLQRHEEAEALTKAKTGATGMVEGVRNA